MTSAGVAGRGARRALFLAGAFCAGLLILGLLGYGAVRLFLWHPWSADDRDSRADPGSGDVSLSKSLRLTGLTLPAGATNVRYYVKANMRGTLVQLTYRIPCGTVPGVLADAKLTTPVAMDAIGAQNVRRFAERHGWRPDAGTTTALTDTRTWPTTALVNTPPAAVDCSVYIDAFN